MIINLDAIRTDIHNIRSIFHKLHQYGLILDYIYADMLETTDMQLQILTKVQSQYGETIELQDSLSRTPEPKDKEQTRNNKNNTKS